MRTVPNIGRPENPTPDAGDESRKVASGPIHTRFIVAKAKRPPKKAALSIDANATVLTLGELEALTRFRFTVFLTLDDAAVTCEEAGRFQRAAQ